MCIDCKGPVGFSPKSLGLLLLRLVVAGIFLYHGWNKFMFMDNTVIFFGTLGLAPFFAYFIALVEVVGGLFMLLGAFPCVTGIMLALDMVVAIFLVKLSSGFVGMETELLLFAGSLALALMGSGRYAIMKHCPCKWCRWCKQDGGCACCGGGCKDCKDCAACKDGVCALPKTEKSS